MKKSLFVIIALLSVNSISFGQFKLLKELREGDKSGLPYIFNGNLIGDKLYFQGFNESSDIKIYETQGTEESTIEFDIQENSDPIIHFGNESIVIRGDNLKLFDGSELKTIQFFNGINLQKPHQWGDQYIFIGSSSEDVYLTDGTESGSKLLFSFDEKQSNTKTTTGNEVAVITSSFDNFEPILIADKGNVVTTVKEYLSPYKTLESVDNAFVYGDLLFLQAFETGSFKNFIFNTNTQDVEDWFYIEQILYATDIGDKFVIFTRDKCYSIDPVTFDYETLNSKVYRSSHFHKKDDVVYFNAEGSSSSEIIFYKTDGTVSGTSKLANTVIGEFGQPTMAVELDGKLYYTKSDGGFLDKEFTLMSFDLTSEEIVPIGIVKQSVGSLILDLGMFVVNNKLVTSRYLDASGHEIYVMDLSLGNNIIKSDKEKILNSNLVEHVLSINLPYLGNGFLVYDINGNLMKKDFIENGLINVEELPSGQYFIMVYDGNSSQTERFVKI